MEIEKVIYSQYAETYVEGKVNDAINNASSDWSHPTFGIPPSWTNESVFEDMKKIA